MRVQPSDISVETIKAMGARPVAVPFDRVTAALKASVVDASENSGPAYSSACHDRVAKYYRLTEHSIMQGVLVFSKRVWSELSSDDRRRRNFQRTLMAKGGGRRVAACVRFPVVPSRRIHMRLSRGT